MRFFQNLKTLSRALRLKKIDAAELHTGLWDASIALGFAVLSWGVVQALDIAGPIRLDPWALSDLVSWYGAFTLLLVLSSAILLAFKDAPALVVSMFYIWIFGNILSGFAAFFEVEALYYVVFALPIILTLLCAFALLRGSIAIALLRAVVFVGVLTAGQNFATIYLPYPEPLVATTPQEQDAETDYVRIETEELYAAQSELMSAQTAELKAQTDGQIDIYGLVLGGTAYQSVFRSEAEQVTALLAKDYNAEGRVLTLVNSNSHPNRFSNGKQDKLA